MLNTFRAWWDGPRHILSLNQRNVTYILRENDRRLYPWVDDKLKTKQRLAEHKLATPRLIGSISTHREVGRLEQLLKNERQFAVKPAQGSCGGGILIIADRTRKGFRKPNGQIITPDDLSFHMHNILSGLHSLGGQEDEVLIESLILGRELIPNLPLQGVPDIRILLFRGIPVAAMLRLPTFESDGKANLHMGGVGVGIDVGTGLSAAAVHRNRAISYHPEYDCPLLGHIIPEWETMLEIATRVYDAIPLGYMGIDLVLDKTHGPLVLEANARPGISIQLANRWGLLPRLQQIEQETCPLETSQQRLDYARTHFSLEMKVESLEAC